MDNTELCFLSAEALAAGFRVREFSVSEVVEAILDRIDQVNPFVNAYCTVTPDRARAEAEAADRGLASGNVLGPLHGVPVSIKDLVHTRGVRTTSRSRVYADFVPDEDAPLVARLRAAGAIMLGKTNTSEFGWKSPTDNVLFGPTRNPWTLTRTAAGSSGGAAAARAVRARSRSVATVRIESPASELLRRLRLQAVVWSLARIYRFPYPGEPPMQDQPAARTTFFDAALQRHLAGIDQLVILGAGLDTRAYRLPAGTRVRCFEVDTPWTQTFKREMLRRAGLEAARVTYVPADFEHEDWSSKLVAAGFEPDQPSFFLWESVTMYLDRQAVERALRQIAGTARGSVVAFDYFSSELLQVRSPFWRYARAVLQAVGELFGTFGINSTPPARQHVAAFVAACGLSLEEQRNFGQETDRRHAQAGFATAIVRGCGGIVTQQVHSADVPDHAWPDPLLGKRASDRRHDAFEAER